ncbi:hypothetical protein [Streptomyces sp. NPDC014746]|uniref:hypothetical protein n=1 Tax=Streptomyces sp. NPDC014746 TaxID=3364904 RepID=UPI0036FAF3F2
MRIVRRIVTGLSGAAVLAALAFASVAVGNAVDAPGSSVVSAEPDWGKSAPRTSPAKPREPDWD